MSRRVALLVGAVVCSGGLALVPPDARAADPYTVETLHFSVRVGPANEQTCDIVGDLYTPTAATASRPAPAILTTNGFGGSKDDQAPLARLAATNGYVVLSYSGLGFGGSTCKITLDDPDYDGKAGKQLIDFLAGLPAVKKDKGGDPKVGMVGGSYGGSIQFAVASVDPRLDTIVPLITWNDLSYSIGPNNTDQVTGVSTGTPGVIKLLWGAGFSGLGVLNGLQNGQQDPARNIPCPNFADFVCPALVTAGTTGYFQPDAVAALRHASVASYMSKIKIPTLLMQGQNDTLFNLNEAVATYKALKAQGTPVKMVWHSWGHSGGPAPGEIDLGNPDPTAQYETGRIMSWFDHYLKGTNASTGPTFAYFRDWVGYTGNASPAFATSNAFPVGTAKSYTLSGASSLATSTPSAGSNTFTTIAAGAPTSINPFDVLGGYAPVPAMAPTDVPGTFASWTTSVLASKVDVVGSPVVTLRINAPANALTQGAGPSGQLVLFVKVLDVAPDGTASLIHGLEAPIRIPDVSNPFKVTLPAIVHRFAAGHQIRLVISGGSNNYRGGVSANLVTITSGPGQTLALPVVS
ncbi:MAG TPA: alpha/beta fold hydrolase [Nocardioidaceae bacterium]|nr:alpha/beta fold hydrolase [Nocardioidaceae bacterium]